MKKLFTGLLPFLLLAAQTLAEPTGSSNQVLRIPNGGGPLGKYGSIDVTQSATAATTTTNGNILQSNGTSWAALAHDGSYELINVGLSASISSNTLVVALKQADGSSDCTSALPCMADFRTSTATSGGFARKLFTDANSVTLAAADSIGFVQSMTGYVYAYLISDTTSEICLSAALFDDGSLQSATALTGGSDTTYGLIYCTNAHTSKPIRLVGRIAVTWSNPNWGSLTETAILPFSNVITQSTQWAKAIWPGVSNCVWTTSGTSLAAFSADTDCTLPAGGNLTGYAAAPATKIPSIVVTTVPAARYEVIVMAHAIVKTSSTGNSIGCAIYDGNTYSGLQKTSVTDVSFSVFVGEFTYTSPQTAKTFSVYCFTGNAGQVVTFQNDSTEASQGLTFIVNKYNIVP